MADPYASPSDARAYYAGQDASGVMLNVPMRQAARFVQQYAPVPEVVPADYAEMAADAELEVGRFLFNTQGGSISSVGAEGANVSFTDLEKIKSLIKATMGTYYTSGNLIVQRITRG